MKELVSVFVIGAWLWVMWTACDHRGWGIEHIFEVEVTDPFSGNEDKKIVGDFVANYISIHNEPCEAGFGPLKIRIQETPYVQFEFVEVDCGFVTEEKR